MKELQTYVTGTKAATVSLILLATIAVAFVLYILKPILIPFLIAVMLSYILYPFVERLSKYKIPRIITLLVVFLIALGALGKIVEILISNIISLSGNFPEYKTQFSALLNDYSLQYPWLESILENIKGMLFSLPIGGYTNSLINSSVNFFSNTFLILLFVTYLVLSIHSYPAKIQKAFSGTKGTYILKVWSDINRDIRKYLDIHTLISLATGISVGLVCWLFGVPFAFLWGFLAFVLNYIPTIGSIVASIPPVITAAVVLGIYPAIWVTVLMIVIQLIWGNIVEPKFAGKSLGLSSLTILLSLVFWGWLWGIVGTILAVPIASMIKIICENIDALKPISELMGD